MGEKIHGNGILDAETRKKDEEKAFLAQVENLPHITEIQRIMQNHIHFWRKKFCIPFASANYFAKLYVSDYQIIMM